jgi:hypothetical protein
MNEPYCLDTEVLTLNHTTFAHKPRKIFEKQMNSSNNTKPSESKSNPATAAACYYPTLLSAKKPISKKQSDRLTTTSQRVPAASK